MQVDGQMPVAPFLLTAQDLETLAQTDVEFQPHTWSDLKQMISRSDYARVKRYPSQLRAYTEWSRAIVADDQYGSSTAFVRKEILHWSEESVQTPIKPDQALCDPRDYQVLLTDWSYAVEPGIRHLVVWMKHFLKTDSEGSLTKPEVQVVDSFVKRWFVDRISRSCIQTPQALGIIEGEHDIEDQDYSYGLALSCRDCLTCTQLKGLKKSLTACQTR